MDSTAASITDDQELAKVLESMNQQATGGIPPIPTDDSTAPAADPTVPAEPVADSQALEQALEAPADAQVPPAPVETPATLDAPAAPAYDAPTAPADAVPATPSYDASTPNANPELEAIKKDALEELRPLVDKLDLPADEKFDTLLLIIRSTDDKSLVTAAHEAARAIQDETKRAQALLDVIKEIDYFAGHGPQPA